LPHLEDDESGSISDDAAAANAPIDATDPASVMNDTTPADASVATSR
jgi:hypothetical protein